MFESHSQFSLHDTPQVRQISTLSPVKYEAIMSGTHQCLVQDVTGDRESAMSPPPGLDLPPGPCPHLLWREMDPKSRLSKITQEPL
jgi:hypothetical protein